MQKACGRRDKKIKKWREKDKERNERLGEGEREREKDRERSITEGFALCFRLMPACHTVSQTTLL